MGHGKWRATDDHGGSDVPRKPECGCKWLKKPGWMGVRNQPRICFYICVPTLSCMNMHTHAHVNSYMFNTKTHNYWMLTGIKASSAMNQVKFASESLSLFPHPLPHSPGALTVPPKAPWSRDERAPAQDPASPAGALPSTPPRSLTMSSVSRAFQARCSGAP